MRLLILLLCLLSLGAHGCARTYHLTRFDGSQISIESYKWGDQVFYYKVEHYENGKIRSEAYGFERRISPVLAEVGNVAKSVLAGAKEAL